MPLLQGQAFNVLVNDSKIFSVVLYSISRIFFRIDARLCEYLIDGVAWEHKMRKDTQEKGFMRHVNEGWAVTNKSL